MLPSREKAGNVAEQEGRQVEELGELEGGKGGLPHVGLGDGGSGEGRDAYRRSDVGILRQPVDDHVSRNRADAQFGQGRYGHHGGDQVGGGDGHTHAQDQRDQGDEQNGQPELAVRQRDHDIGEGEHQPAVGQHADDDADDAHGGTDLETVLGRLCAQPPGSAWDQSGYPCAANSPRYRPPAPGWLNSPGNSPPASAP